MNSSFDLPDSTDWLDSSLPAIAPLESALRCQICKDFFSNPVITSCSHTFCSLCIRRCLSAEGKCPTCRSSDQVLKLRRNGVVQEIVESFQNARSNVLALARQAQTATATEETEDLMQPASKRRRLHGPEDETVARQPEMRRTRSQNKQLGHELTPEISDAVDDIRDEEYVPDDGLVPCPMCNRRMKEQAVFNHLDNCAGPNERGNKRPPTKIPRAPPQSSFGTLRNSAPAKTLVPLPTLPYSLFKEVQLRKKLKELGIPDWGPRALLQRRHTEWMNLWNANCDAKLPKTKGELLRDLDVWERSQGGGAAQPGALTGPNAVMAKNFDAAAWSTNHDNDFKRLIENARKKKGNKNEDIQPSQSSEPATNVSMNSQQDATMPLRSIDGENPVSTAEQPYLFTETSTQVNMPGNAERLDQPLPSFMLEPEIMRPAEGDPGP